MLLMKGRPWAAGVMLCAVAGTTHAGDPQGYDPKQADVLREMPVHVVMLNDTLRSQIAFQSYSVAADAVGQQSIQNAMMGAPGLSMGQAAAAGAVGGAIASAIINAQLLAQAKAQVEPAEGELRRQGCQISYGNELSEAISRAVAGSHWGQSAPAQRHVLAPKQSLADVVSPSGERYTLTASYSMSPDYSALLTSVTAAAYSSRLDQAPRNWQKNPAWSDDLVVVSDRVLIAPKAQADIDAAVAAEMQRYAQFPIADLVREANAGDREARSKAAKLMAENKRNLKLAREQAWTPAAEAEQRSRVWSANGCEKLRQALASNTNELEGMLSQLFRGELPPRVNERPKGLLAAATAGERQVIAEPIGVYRLTRGGDSVPLAFRYSWLPASKAE